MTEREKRKRSEKIHNAGKIAKHGVAIVKALFIIIGLVLVGLVLYGIFSAGNAINNVLSGLIGG